MFTWLVDGLIPLDNRIADVAPEGGVKTTFGAYMAVCIATSMECLGHPVRQGPVLIVDAETPRQSLLDKLDRFAQGIGFPDAKDLDITCLTGSEFRFGRKTERDKLLRVVDEVKPVFIRMDSMLSMLPGGRQGVSENDCGLGEMLRDDMAAMMGSGGRSVMLAMHAKKPAAELTPEQLLVIDMQTVTRGHGSIIGEGCDTGLMLKKFSERPLRFALIAKSRRVPIPASGQITIVEMKEAAYGEGPAYLEVVPADVIPPTEVAKQLYTLFRDGKEHCSKDIVKVFALFTRTECRLAINELKMRGIIIGGSEPQAFKLNPNRPNSEYAQTLDKLP